MKKILVVHTKYQELGGEDIAVEKEIQLLEKYFDVETLFFDNKIDNYFKQLTSFLINDNKESKRKLEEKINKFNPDYVYVHNTWFKGSLGVFKVIESKQLKAFIKLHNFRYDCTRSYLSSKHLGSNTYCQGCGMNKRKVRFFNKYFPDSYIKSFLIIRYGKLYFKVLKESDIELIVLTKFHKNYLEKLNIRKDKIHLIPNFIGKSHHKFNKINEKYILYAGRLSKEKGIEELISAFLKTDNKEINLKIVGNGPLYNNLKNKYKNTRVEIIGGLPNDKVLNLIKNSIAVISATKLYEGQPTLLCEASRLGILSIFPDSGGIKEFFPDKYTFSFDQNNYTQLIEKINALNDKEAITNVQNNNFQYFEENFSEEIIIRKFKELIQDEK